MDWMEYGLNGVDAIRVVVSCVTFYIGIILLMRVFGQRTLSSLSSFDVAAIIAMGAVIGRAILGDTPTLAAVDFWDLGLPTSAGKCLEIYDCIEHENIGKKSEMLTATVAAHGSKVYRCKMVKKE